MNDFNVDSEYKRLYEEHLEDFYEGFALNPDSLIRRYPGSFNSRKWIYIMMIGTVLSLIISFVANLSNNNHIQWLSSMFLNFSMGFFVSFVFLIFTEKKSRLENYLVDGVTELQKQQNKIHEALHIIEVQLSFSVNDYQKAYLYMRFATEGYLMIEEYLEQLDKVFDDDRIKRAKDRIHKYAMEMHDNHVNIYNPGFIEAFFRNTANDFTNNLVNHVKEARRINLYVTTGLYEINDFIYDLKTPILDNKYSKIRRE